jgi:hypothetical protein
MMNNKYYKPGGPVFLKIGGEGAITDGGFIQTGKQFCKFVGNFAREFLANGTLLMEYLRAVIKYNGMAFQLEHRYYGDSKPIKFVKL